MQTSLGQLDASCERIWLPYKFIPSFRLEQDIAVQTGLEGHVRYEDGGTPLARATLLR